MSVQHAGHATEEDPLRDETAAWLIPMLTEARKRGMDVWSLLFAASMPAAEADTPMGDWLAEHVPRGSGVIDWVRYGQLLRRQLGWEDTYPADPELRDEP